METRLTGKVAIVTGAGQGIGKGIARRLAREGATVVIAEYNAENAAAAAVEIEAAGWKAIAYPIDISDVAAVQRMVADIAERLGHIDLLVNNAGVAQTKPMLNLTPDDWDRVLDVNLRGTFFLIQAVAQEMIRQAPEALRSAASAPADIMAMKKPEVVQKDGEELAASYGKIVSLSSIAGRRGRPLQTHYAATKAGIISLTQSTALALAPYRINANAVCPGIVPTPMWQQIDEERGRLFGAQPGEAMAAFINTVPLKRAATADDIAAAVAFFCSADADYITGQALNVDGGYEMD
jgi:meso-butanediol dehydrogenase / (S,S)-butanediol dehydrogenase / diacetyl reductase